MKIRFIFLAVFAFVLTASTIDLTNLPNYGNQTVPTYITKDNTNGNPITDVGATLGRVLFYDKNLSANNVIACGSCHQQAFAFSDTALVSSGLSGGTTGRHSMRLVNVRFADETHFFWDERATTLEDQTTQPIQDHIEMGFSGTNGDPGIDSLLRKLENIPYYSTLFSAVYGDPEITENRIQLALAQFIRSIQSFDAKYDEGRAQVNNDNQNFPNFTTQENAGKQLFLAPPNQGGAGCAGCHRPPEFDIDPNANNNGITGVAGTAVGTDYTNTRAPSLRDVVNPDGTLNGPLMHTGEFNSLAEVIEHYNLIPNDPNNPNLDNRLIGPGGDLQLTNDEKENLAAFLRTLTGNAIYTDEKWSSPFDGQGHLTIEGTLTSGLSNYPKMEVTLYPNPVKNVLNIENSENSWVGTIYSLTGKPVGIIESTTSTAQANLAYLTAGTYLLKIKTKNTTTIKRFIKL